MEASILDLRYNMKAVHRALQRNEVVKITYHGKLIGKILPCAEPSQEKVESHPFFGMQKADKESVETVMTKLRGTRYHDL